MTKLLALFVFPLALVAADAPKLPTEVKLANGAVLRKVSVVRFQGDTVILKHQGGVDPVRMANLAIADRAAFEAERKRATAEPSLIPVKDGLIRGQVFVATRGAGSYRFGNALVEAYPAEEFETFIAKVKDAIPFGNFAPRGQAQHSLIRDAVMEVSSKYQSNLLASVRTNSDGEFVLEANRPVFLVCTTSRMVGAGYESNAWVVKASGGPVLLSNTNQVVVD